MDFKALMKLVPEATELPLDFDAIPDGFAIHTDNVTALLLGTLPIFLLLFLQFSFLSFHFSLRSCGMSPCMSFRQVSSCSRLLLFCLIQF